MHCKKNVVCHKTEVFDEPFKIWTFEHFYNANTTQYILSKFYLFTNWCTSKLSWKNNIKIYIKTAL